ncbi:MAG TPA: hypothetical protein VF647_11095 [Longimicrobium sp.]|jgi:hypothetical protein
MKFISIDGPQDRWDEIREAVTEDTIALTSGGEPFALAVDLKDFEDPAELDIAIRQLRVQHAIARVREDARRNGTDQLTMDDIDAEIRAARAERRRSGPS